MTTKPTLTHLVAADGSAFSVTTRIVNGVLRVDVYRDAESRKQPKMTGEFTAKEG